MSLLLMLARELICARCCTGRVGKETNETNKGISNLINNIRVTEQENKDRMEINEVGSISQEQLCECAGKGPDLTHLDDEQSSIVRRVRAICEKPLLGLFVACVALFYF